MTPIIKIRLNDRLKLKKPHPCGGTMFRVLRVGSEIRIVCETCGRDMTVDRIKLEKAVKKVFPFEDGQEEKQERN